MREGSSDAVRVALLGGEVKLSALVQALRRRGREASLGEKQAGLQSLIDGRVAAELGRRPREPKRASQAGRVSRWSCHRCGSVEANDFSYSGCYERGITFEEGLAKVRIPRIRCRCGGSVPPDFGPVLPKRKRLWFDVSLDVIERYVSGGSYRSIRETYQHRGVYVGLSSLPPLVGQCWQVGLHGRPRFGCLQAAQADGAFWRVAGQSLAILHVTEVLPRQASKGVGRYLVQHETGQVVGSLVAPAETLEHWTVVFDDIQRRGFVTEAADLFLTSDGNQGLRGAADWVFGFETQQRCTWHIGHRAREYAPRATGHAVENAVHHIFNAPDLGELHERFKAFVHRWQSRAPQAVKSVARKLPQALSFLVATDHPIRPKTSAMAERHNLEYKRRLRSTRGLYKAQNLAAIVRLIDLRHNCARRLGDDWLHHVARDLWPQPVQLRPTTTTTRPPPPPTTTAYTIGGT